MQSYSTTKFSTIRRPNFDANNSAYDTTDSLAIVETDSSTIFNTINTTIYTSVSSAITYSIFPADKTTSQTSNHSADKCAVFKANFSAHMFSVLYSF